MKSMLARKFLMPLAGIALVALNRKLNLGLSTADLMVIAGLIVGFVLGESHVDASRSGVAPSPSTPPKP